MQRKIWLVNLKKIQRNQERDLTFPEGNSEQQTKKLKAIDIKLNEIETHIKMLKDIYKKRLNRKMKIYFLNQLPYLTKLKSVKNNCYDWCNYLINYFLNL